MRTCNQVIDFFDKTVANTASYECFSKLPQELKSLIDAKDSERLRAFLGNGECLADSIRAPVA